MYKRQVFGYSHLDKVTYLRPWFLPLFPYAHAYSVIDVYKRQVYTCLLVSIVSPFCKSPQYSCGIFDAFALSTSNFPAPVSYTHLDVYKRQPLASPTL